jgi:hypothetical protein
VNFTNIRLNPRTRALLDINPAHSLIDRIGNSLSPLYHNREYISLSYHHRHYYLVLWQVHSFVRSEFFRECFLFQYTVKKKESRNRPGVAQRVSGGLGSQISWHSARESGEVVSLTHRPPLPQECSWYTFSLGTESTPGPCYGRKEICHWIFQWHHRESIPGPSD